ncbi:actin-related protein 5 isoform X1 [Rhagoletis pomonella]|uniref:actin-related protein 5 isoform X1 n=1 Tax=Rhagoletis pomonella TaxID=28610 RepID=UPI00177E6A36|nr:actin-related protein 5 isoform X1 [Rhagoletis pomonella]
MNIINLVENPTKADIFHSYDNGLEQEVLVIDNGSFKCRAGWSSSPNPLLEFRNILLKPRRDRRKEVLEPLANKHTQIGNAITNIESVRLNLKTQFDRNVVTHFHNQEQIFDYIFAHLGVNNEENFSHPVLLTEAIGNPNYFRQQMNELLFECYGIPSVCYGIDSLFSWRQNAIGADTLIISFGYHTIHVLPVLNGIIKIENMRRLNLGGYHIIYYLHRLMQMKYPMHINSITISKIETLLHCHSSIALDYLEALRRWSDIDYYTENVKKIQLAFAPPIVQNTLQNLDQKMEKRKELTKRLIEINARRAKNKQLDLENQLRFMSNVRDLYEFGETEEFESALKQNNIENLSMLDKTITSLKGRLQQMESTTQDASLTASRVQKEKSSSSKKPPSDVPIEKWVSEVNYKREEILRRKELRKARRQEAAKRHTAAAQERMRIISLLANNDKGVDTFGVNDNDWDVYKSINKDNESDSDSDNDKLLEYENILRQYDPSFKQSATQTTDVAENYQLHFSVESIRAPEVIFQPSLIGCSEMGLAELIEFVLKLFPEGEQQRLVNNIFLTGGCSQFIGLKERLSKELREMRPFQTPFQIYAAQSPELDAWIGAKDFAHSNVFSDSLSSKKDYEEKGSDYFKEHSYSNRYYANM